MAKLPEPEAHVEKTGRRNCFNESNCLTLKPQTDKTNNIEDMEDICGLTKTQTVGLGQRFTPAHNLIV